LERTDLLRRRRVDFAGSHLQQIAATRAINISEACHRCNNTIDNFKFPFGAGIKLRAAERSRIV
jgi:hypothetical protein